MKIASQKSYTVAVCLSGVFGVLGFHHFYLGRWLHGIVDLGMTVTGVGLLIAEKPLAGFAVLAIDFLHTLVVTIQLLIGTYKDGDGHIVTYPNQVLK